MLNQITGSSKVCKPRVQSLLGQDCILGCSLGLGRDPQNDSWHLVESKNILIVKSKSIPKCHLVSSTLAGTAVCGGIGKEDKVEAPEAVGA